MTRQDKITDNAIAIIGAGGHAKVVVAALGERDAKPISIFDDAAAQTPIALFDQVVAPLPPPQWWDETARPPHAHIAIGDNQARQALSKKIPTTNWATIIHPSAIIHHSAKIGHGVFISARATIQPDAVIGDHTIINTGAIIEHDCRIGDFCHIAPRVTLCGNTHVGIGTLIGVGSVTIPNIRIGAWATLGAGSTVVRDVEDRSTVFGNPATKRDVT